MTDVNKILKDLQGLEVYPNRCNGSCLPGDCTCGKYDCAPEPECDSCEINDVPCGTFDPDSIDPAVIAAAKAVAAPSAPDDVEANMTPATMPKQAKVQASPLVVMAPAQCQTTPAPRMNCEPKHKVNVPEINCVVDTGPLVKEAYESAFMMMIHMMRESCKCAQGSFGLDATQIYDGEVVEGDADWIAQYKSALRK